MCGDGKVSTRCCSRGHRRPRRPLGEGGRCAARGRPQRDSAAAAAAVGAAAAVECGPEPWHGSCVARTGRRRNPLKRRL